MPNKLKLYIAIIVTTGILFAASLFDRIENFDLTGFIFFTILSIIAESMLIASPNERGLSVGFAVGLSSILLFGIPVAAFITGLGVAFRAAKIQGKLVHILNAPIYKTLFNTANIVLSTGIAGLCYQVLGGAPRIININNSIIPIIACILVYVVINSTIMSILMSMVSEETFWGIWYDSIIWVMKDYFAIAPLGIIMAIAYTSYGKLGVLLFFGPLLLARFSFKMYVDMKSMYIETVKSLCTAMEAKDPYTQGHSARVSEYACRLAARLGLSRRKIENIKIAGILHDIGKIGIEEKILNKTEKLNDNEFTKIKQHPSIGYKIVHDIGFLSDAAKIILSHHERYDGSGYPNGLKEAEISREACIISICDAFDAITSDRPYRKALTWENALEIIESDKCKNFDPAIANEFIKMIKEERHMKSVS